MSRLLNTRVAVAAIYAKLGNMVCMTEGNWLLQWDANFGIEGRTTDGRSRHHQPKGRDDQNDYANLSENIKASWK